jgi:hypothetical protein
MPILLQVKVAEGSASTPAKFADSDTPRPVPTYAPTRGRQGGHRTAEGSRHPFAPHRGLRWNGRRGSIGISRRAPANQVSTASVAITAGWFGLVHGRPAAVPMSSTCSPAAMLGRTTPTRSLTTQHPLMRSRRRCRLNLACAYATGHGSVWAKHAHFRQTAPINGTRDSFAKCARLRPLMRARNHRSPSLK